MIYLTCMGEIWRISKTKYRRYLKEIAEKGCADLTNYATFCGRAYNVTDICRGEAQLILDGGRVSSLPTLDGRDHSLDG